MKTLALAAFIACAPIGAFAETPVTVDNFVRAETDITFKRYVDQGAFGKMFHIRQPTPIDRQGIIRMNRDTLYSAAVIDLTTPVTITKPETDGRFQSLLIINQDHYVPPVVHEAGEITLTQEEIGTRYVMLLFRTFVDANDPADIRAANELQDQIVLAQADIGAYEVTDWDEASHKRLHGALLVLAATLTDTSQVFGLKDEVNPIHHLIGAAFGWGGNPAKAAIYDNASVEQNDGIVAHSITVGDVPVDGFWSITVYNVEGFMEANDLNAYSFNGVTADKNGDGTTTVNFGGCADGRVNCLPITQGWNYIVRLYQPRQAILDGSWKFPAAEPLR